MKHDKKTFKKAVKQVLFSQPKAHAQDKHPTRKESEQKWRLDHREK